MAPYEDLERKRACAALEAALRALPLRKSSVFLRISDERRCGRPAQAMGCSEGSVETYLLRVLQVSKKRSGEHRP